MKFFWYIFILLILKNHKVFCFFNKFEKIICENSNTTVDDIYCEVQIFQPRKSLTLDFLVFLNRNKTIDMENIVKFKIYNSIQNRIPEDLFEQILKNITTFEIFNSTLEKLSKDDFKGAEKLTTFNASGCELTELDEKTFTEVPELINLILSNNKINKINKGAFDELNNLEKLDLSNNKLKNLDFNNFHDLKNLKELNIHGNLLKEINIEIILPNLQNITIYNNSWNCEFLYNIYEKFNKIRIEIYTPPENFVNNKKNINGIGCVKKINLKNYKNILLYLFLVIILIVFSLIFYFLIQKIIFYFKNAKKFSFTFHRSNLSDNCQITRLIEE